MPKAHSKSKLCALLHAAYYTNATSNVNLYQNAARLTDVAREAVAALQASVRDGKQSTSWYNLHASLSLYGVPIPAETPQTPRREASVTEVVDVSSRMSDEDEFKLELDEAAKAPPLPTFQRQLIHPDPKIFDDDEPIFQVATPAAHSVRKPPKERKLPLTQVNNRQKLLALQAANTILAVRNIPVPENWDDDAKMPQ